jgi:branched-chain amino acid transport system substrate-binding protein
MASILRRLIVCLIALLAYGLSPAGLSPARSEILVGAALPATGPNSWLGAPTKAGIQRAIDDLNEKGGLLGEQLAIAWADDKCEPAAAATAADQLVRKGVRVVIGHQCSGAALEAARIYDKNGVVLISSSATTPALTENGWPYIFRVIGRDDQQGAIAAAYLARNFARSKIAILHDSRLYGRGLAELMRQSLHQRGIQEVIYEGITREAVPDMVHRMQELGVEVIYYAGYVDVGGPLRKQSWEEGLRGPMLAGDGILTPNYRYEAGEEAAAETLATNAPDFRDEPTAATVVSAILHDREEVFPQTLRAYAAVQAWAQAVKMAGTTEGYKVATELHTGTFATVLGSIGFTAKGDLSGPLTSFVWYTWRKGTYIELDPANWKHRGLVCRTQAGRNALGYSAGQIDSVAGPLTRGAINRFVSDKKRKEEIPYSSTIDEALVAAIERNARVATRRGPGVSPPPWTRMPRPSRAERLGLLCRSDGR